MLARLLVVLVVFLVASLSACGDGGGGEPAAPDAAPLPLVFGGDRPVTLQVPSSYDPARAYPLLVILHGYSANALAQQAYFGLIDAADARDALILAPDGTKDQLGNRFWNASDACCDLGGTGVDDVAYVSGLIEEVAAAYAVDPARVFLIGHSNGGYMSYRMACERPDLIAAIASLAGAAAFADPATCSPDQPVSVLAIHGDADTVVLYPGGTSNGATYPGARDSVARWADYDGCDGALGGTTTLDLEEVLAGAETTVEAVAGCPTGIGVELWTVQGGSHIPRFDQPAFIDGVWAWLGAHPRP